MRVLLAILLMAISGEASSVTGRVRFLGRAPGVTAPTIVYAESLDGRHVQPGKFKMEQKNKSFSPHVLAVPVGSGITFPNQDPIFHNVFSLSRPGPFDLGLYRDGESKTWTFTAPATYHVFCNIHPQMSAVILVLPTSYITEADAMGSYRLDLPPGRYRLTAWSERGEPANVELMVGSSGMNAPELSVDESKFVNTQHKNKYGQDYPKK
jgi:plastocyanin